MATGRRNFTLTDDDIYTEDDNLDAVLMTAPDEAYCRVCGGSIVTDGASDWQHVDAWITDHRAPALRYPCDGHPRGAVVLTLGRSAQRKSSDGPESAAAHVDLRRGREASDFAARKGANTWETH